MQKNFKTLLNIIKAFVLDVDGVLTDGNLLLLENGELGRRFNTKDGHALQAAVAAGFTVALVTSARAENLRTRFKALGVHEVYLDSRDKEEALKEFSTVYGIEPQHLLYMGDDLPDLPALRLAGIAACPADAAHEIKAACIYVSPFGGGQGCVRDVIEQALRVQGKWEK